MIRQASNNRHWNYFLALDNDATVVSRFVEFTTDNYDTYSIELGRLLMAASSEVDVVAKLACAKVAHDNSAENIDDYRFILVPGRPLIPTYPVCIQRFGLNLTPWENWKSANTSPDWWKAYNKVKHQRSDYFHLATLQNALNALAGLFVMLIYAFPEDAALGVLVPPTLLSIPDGAHDGWTNMGTYTTVHYRV